MIAESERRVEEDDSCAEIMRQVGDRIQSKEKKSILLCKLPCLLEKKKVFLNVGVFSIDNHRGCV